MPTSDDTYLRRFLNDLGQSVADNPWTYVPVAPVTPSGVVMTGSGSFIATDGQTTFVVTFALNTNVLVFRNGDLQLLGTDFTLSGTSTVVFTQPQLAGDWIQITQL